MTALKQSPIGGPASTRLMSIDALRGFDMFWIVGAEGLFEALQRMTNNPVVGFFSNQLTHRDWNGFVFYDLIFPMFVFIMGVSLVFSLSKTLQERGRGTALKRIARRTLLLLLIGIFYYGAFANEWPNIRLLGVLQRIALCYGAAAVIFCFFRLKGMIVISAGLLLGYWVILSVVPIRDIALEPISLQKLSAAAGTTNVTVLFQSTTNYVRGGYEKGKNLPNHLDFEYLPGRKHEVYWDPEGLLSTLPAVVTCLLGIFAGLLLKAPGWSEKQKVQWLVAGGVMCVAAGYLWGLQFPVVKKIWTSSFVLVAGGYSAILLGVFYLLIDVLKFQRWCMPFVWIGTNSIAIYLASSIIGLQRMANRFVGGTIKNYLDDHVAAGFGELGIAVVALLLAIWFCRFLYERKLFLRL